jgi:hypothetical protein
MINDPANKADNAMYTITFSANVSEQLTVSYQDKSSGGYVLLEAAALS